jgi:hypothetical protein
MIADVSGGEGRVQKTKLGTVIEHISCDVLQLFGITRALERVNRAAPARFLAGPLYNSVARDHSI